MNVSIHDGAQSQMDQSVSDSDLTTFNGVGSLSKKNFQCQRARKKAKRNKNQVVFDPKVQIRLENLTISLQAVLVSKATTRIRKGVRLF